MQRRNFLKLLGARGAAGAVLEQPRLWPWGLRPEINAPVTSHEYGLSECPDSNLLRALSRSRAGILACTVNDQTHCPDAGHKWGTDTFLNDLYFGLHGGLFVGGEDQHEVFRKEMRKIAQRVKTSPNHPPVPWAVSADGCRPDFNLDGMDLDRCAQFVLETVRVYELTGDQKFFFDLYPQCIEVLQYLTARDLDGDSLPEGRAESFTDPPSKGVGDVQACLTSATRQPTPGKISAPLSSTMKPFDGWPCSKAFSERSLKRAHHLKQAERVRDTTRKILWHDSTDGFLAWIEKDGTAHDDWITGNNLHAVACGLANREEGVKILKKLEEHRAEIRGNRSLPCPDWSLCRRACAATDPTITGTAASGRWFPCRICGRGRLWAMWRALCELQICWPLVPRSRNTGSTKLMTGRRANQMIVEAS